METLIQMLITLIIVILTFVLGNSRRKTGQRRQERQSDVDASSDSEIVLPPFMANFPFETEEAQGVMETEQGDVPLVVEQPEPEPAKEPAAVPPPTPVDSRTPFPTRPAPATSLLNFSPQTFRQGIILAEILGRPKARRTRQ